MLRVVKVSKLSPVMNRKADIYFCSLGTKIACSDIWRACNVEFRRLEWVTPGSSNKNVMAMRFFSGLYPYWKG